MGLELAGKIYGKLTVIERSFPNSHRNDIMWKCKCDCGIFVIKTGSALNRGQTKICGRDCGTLHCDIRICKQCKLSKSLTDFPKSGSSVTGIYSRRTCKLCFKEKKIKRLLENPHIAEKYRQTQRKYQKEKQGNYRINNIRGKLKRYDMTIDAYDAMFNLQNGVCALCNNINTQADKNGILRRLHVDHCHITKKIRGLLCAHCNIAIGMAKDSPELLRKMANYLEK